MGNFFSKFPIIQYSGQSCRNIISRVAIDDVIRQLASVYYPYTIRDDKRIDSLSYDYYDDSDMVWLVALANNMTDLYYDWPVPDDTFQDHIASKYGSLTAARNQLVFWRNSWVSDDSNITVSDYNALAPGQRRYWNPVISYLGQISGYVRKQEDWTVATNKIQSATCSSVTGTFQTGERVLQSGSPVAYYVTTDSTGLILTLQHILGTVSGTVTGETSGASATVTSVSTISQSIADNEAVYWSPVYAFDYEMEQNQKNRSILLLDNRYAAQAKKQLKTIFKS